MDCGFVTNNAVRMAQAARRWRRTFLREWRTFRDRSLESVAPQMDITYTQLSKIERGLYPYNQHILEVAALEYGCTITDLLTRAPAPSDVRPAPTRRKA